MVEWLPSSANAGSLHIVQSAASFNFENNEKIWWIPITVKLIYLDSATGEIMLGEVRNLGYLNESKRNFTLNGIPGKEIKGAVFNIDRKIYCRSKYQPQIQTLISSTLKSNQNFLSCSERIGMILDLVALVEMGRLQVGPYPEIWLNQHFGFLISETSLNVLKGSLVAIKRLANYLRRDKAVMDWIVYLIDRKAKHLSWEVPNQNHAFFDIREELFSAGVWAGSAELFASAKGYFKATLGGSDIVHPSLKKFVYIAALVNGTQADVDILWESAQISLSLDKVIGIVSNELSFESHDVFRLFKLVKSEDLSSVVIQMTSATGGHKHFWNYLIKQNQWQLGSKFELLVEECVSLMDDTELLNQASGIDSIAVKRGLERNPNLQKHFTAVG